jgi:aminopeptidase N
MEKKRYNVWAEHQADTFTFQTVSRPGLINVDGDKALLCEKTEHKDLDNYIFQYKNAGLYLDRREAIEFAARTQTEDHKAMDLMKTALKDKYYGLRIFTLQKLNLTSDSVKKAVEPILNEMANNDPKSLVRAGAIEALGRLKKEGYRALFLKATSDSSYSIAGSALLALGAIDTVAAFNQAKLLSEQHAKAELEDAISSVLFTYSGENDYDSLAARFDRMPYGYEKFMILQPFANYLKRIKNPVFFKKGIDLIVKFRDSIIEEDRQQVAAYFNFMILGGIASSKQSSGLTDQADYVKSKLPGNTKSPEANDTKKK